MCKLSGVSLLPEKLVGELILIMLCNYTVQHSDSTVTLTHKVTAKSTLMEPIFKEFNILNRILYDFSKSYNYKRIFGFLKIIY